MSESSAGFVHLHNHSEYSLLDGANRIRDMVSAARKMGMPALALTDHGAMHGIIEFYKECRRQEVKPILGCEVYVTAGSRHDRVPPSAGGAATHHLVLLAKNETGYRNLMKLTSRAFLEGFYYRPRADRELLEEHSEGLIALTACLQGEIPNALLSDNEDKAMAVLGFYQDIFGRDDVYIEIQDHGIDDERRVVPLLRRLATRSGAKIVATNDCHYMEEAHSETQDLLICIGTNKEFDDPNRLKMSTTQLYFKSPDEMRELFRDIPESITNTMEVAARCDVDIALGKSQVPVFPLPAEYECEEDFLDHLARAGLQERYETITPEITERF